MTPAEFWESTIAEIRDLMESYQRRETAKAKQQAAMNYRLSALVSSALVGKLPPIHEAYPGLFDPPDAGQDWRIAKVRLLRYAEAHNRKRRENT